MAESTQPNLNSKLETGKNVARDGVRDFGSRLSDKAGEKGKEIQDQAEQFADRIPEIVRTAQNKVADTVEQVADVASEKAGQATEWLKTKKDVVMEKSDVALSSTREFVRQYPMRTLVAGVAVGAIVGWLFTSRNKNA